MQELFYRCTRLGVEFHHDLNRRVARYNQHQWLGQTNLTNNAAFDSEPAWSPDGAKIAFISERDGNFEIYVMNANGSGQTNLTNNAAYDSQPAWSPDGAKIAFTSERDGNGETYVMNADGSGQTNLTNYPRLDGYPAWSPE